MYTLVQTLLKHAEINMYLFLVLKPIMCFFGVFLTLFFVGQVWVWFEWGEHHRARPLLGRYGHQLTHAGLVNHFFLCVCNQTPICQI